MPVQEMRRDSFAIKRRTVVNGLLTALIATAVCVADQLTKAAAVAHIPLGDSVEFIPGVLNWTYIRNRGMAMGMLADYRWVFMILSVVMIAGIILFVIFAKNASRVTVCILAAILGGGIGNMIDRFAYGYVVDFIDVRLFPFWKWIFNVADMFVTVGAIALAVVCLVHEIKKRKTEKANKEGDKLPETENDV